jgi:hypothetical protein
MLQKNVIIILHCEICPFHVEKMNRIYPSKWSNGSSRRDTMTATATFHVSAAFKSHRYSNWSITSSDDGSTGIVRNTNTFTAMKNVERYLLLWCWIRASIETKELKQVATMLYGGEQIHELKWRPHQNGELITSSNNQIAIGLVILNDGHQISGRDFPFADLLENLPLLRVVPPQEPL